MFRYLLPTAQLSLSLSLSCCRTLLRVCDCYCANKAAFFAFCWCLAAMPSTPSIILREGFLNGYTSSAPTPCYTPRKAPTLIDSLFSLFSLFSTAIILNPPSMCGRLSLKPHWRRVRTALTLLRKFYCFWCLLQPAAIQLSYRFESVGGRTDTAASNLARDCLRGACSSSWLMLYLSVDYLHAMAV